MPISRAARQRPGRRCPVEIQVMGPVQRQVSGLAFTGPAIERSGRRQPIAGAQAVLQIATDLVLAIRQRQVKVTEERLGILHTDHSGGVIALLGDTRLKAVRVDRLDVVPRGGVVGVNVVDVVRVGVIECGVQPGFIVQTQLCVGQQRTLISTALPPSPRAQITRRACVDVLVVDPTAVDRVVAQAIGTEGQKPVARQAGAPPSIGVACLAVTFFVLPITGLQAAPAVLLFEDNVNHPGNRIRAVLRRGTVAQDFNTLDTADRNVVQFNQLVRAPWVDARQTPGRVAALAVDQNQGVRRAQPAQ